MGTPLKSCEVKGTIKYWHFYKSIKSILMFDLKLLTASVHKVVVL